MRQSHGRCLAFQKVRKIGGVVRKSITSDVSVVAPYTRQRQPLDITSHVIAERGCAARVCHERASTDAVDTSTLAETSVPNSFGYDRINAESSRAVH